jgi:hypothetical protein
MSATYKIIVEQEGINHIKIFKAEADGFVNEWNIPLKGDNEPIVFNAFYTESNFAIINWDGWVRMFNADNKEELVNYKLHGKITSRGIFSLDKSELYVAYTNDSINYLATFNLHTYELGIMQLPDVYYDSIEIRKDGNLLFYKHDWERPGDKKIYRHFYSVLDMHTKNIEQFELVYPPQFSFGEFKPVVDIEQNRVIMPAYDDVVYKTNTEGETVFEFRIAIFDLNTFDLKIVSVRDFPKDQLGCSEYESEEMAEAFLSPDRNRDYYDSSLNFYENLTTIKITANGFWLCWRGGIVRKINSDFSMSPLLVTDTRPNNTTKGIFQHAYFHSHLFHIDNSTIVFAEALDFYTCPMPEFNNADIHTPIALHLSKTSLDEIYKLNYSKEQKNEIENLDYIQIEVANLSKKKGFTDALLQMESIVSDLTAAGIGSTLFFIITDKKGKKLQEPEFFAEAINHNPKGVQSIIEKFIQYPKAQYTYRNEEETALCHAVYELAKKGNLYIKTVLQYLAAIDLDHDVFNRENTFPLLEENNKHTTLLKEMKTVSGELAEWYKYYCEG